MTATKTAPDILKTSRFDLCLLATIAACHVVALVCGAIAVIFSA